MSLWLKSYHKILLWSKHPKASYYLGFVSFVDASLFPISPLFMLLPMSFSDPKRSFHFANIAIIFSFLGGIVGYGLGVFAADFIVYPFMSAMGYTPYYHSFVQWFQVWGLWAVLFGCFSPFIPYKIFTIGSGLMKLNFPAFLLASFFGRALRFLLIALFIYWGGPKTELILRRFFVKQ